MQENIFASHQKTIDAWIKEAERLILERRNVEAEVVLRCALVLNPGNPALLIHLGNLVSLPALQRREEAAAAYQHSLMAGSLQDIPLLNIGRLAIEMNQLDIAERYTTAALKINPELTLGFNNLGTIQIRRGDLESAYINYRKAFESEVARPLFRFNVATLQLLFGDDTGEGWNNAEARFEAFPDIWQGPYLEPWWEGQPLPSEQILLLHHEQGLGDTLQCLRYIDDVLTKSTNTILWVQPGLKDLVRPRAGLKIVDQRPKAFDVHCPLFSLPRTLGKIHASSEAVPYIYAAPDREKFWKDWLDGAVNKPGRPYIGFVWSGNHRHLNDTYRSIPFQHFEQLLALSGINWVCLQKDNVSGEITEWLETHQVTNPMPEVTSFADTAAILDNLDLLITIDSSVAHLAGAMGRPTWLLLPGNPDWRWDIRFPTSTPWYPSMRLFRQETPGEWNDVLSAVHSELCTLFADSTPTAWHPLPPPEAQPASPCLLSHVTPDANQDLLKEVASQPFWQHRIALPGVTTPGHAPIAPGAYDLPDSLEGLRVLDVGARDGFWSFEALKRGARQVVAIDDFSDRLGVPEGYSFPAWENFDLCRNALGYDEERCQRYTMSVYEVSEELLGRFDVIFCYGVLHQLRYPLLGLDRLAAICDGELRIESPLLDDFSPYRGGLGKGYDQSDMVMEFYPGKEYAGNPAIKWVPTLQTLGFMLHAAGFENVEGWKLEDKPRLLHQCRGFVTARR